MHIGSPNDKADSMAKTVRIVNNVVSIDIAGWVKPRTQSKK
jgi:hypothetical protein